MSTIEDRLTAALNARADQVHREDLRYAEPPRTPAARTPRVALYVAAAAACAAAIAAPFVLGAGAGEPDPQPLPPTTEAPSPNGDEVPGGDWTVAYRYDDFDVDGDGESDELVIRTKGSEQLPPGPRRMEVNLSSGGQAAVILDYPTYDLTAIDPVELDGEAGDEILYYRGIDDGRDIGVVDLVDGALVDLRVPDDPGITATSTERDGWRGRHYWVEDGRLFSLRTVEGGFVPAGPSPGAPPYQVEVWQWRINDGALQAVPQARQCWHPVKSQLPYPCDAGGPVGLPTRADQADRVILPADYFEADVDGDGADDVIALEGPADDPDGQVEDGEVLLVVSLARGDELTAPIPAGWVPAAAEQLALVDGGPGIFVTQEGGDASPARLYVVRDGELAEVGTAVNEAVRFGNGVDEDGLITSTFVTRDGELFTRVGDPTDPQDQWRFHRWTVDGTTLLPDRNGEVGCWEC